MIIVFGTRQAGFPKSVVLAETLIAMLLRRVGCQRTLGGKLLRAEVTFPSFCGGCGMARNLYAALQKSTVKHLLP